jgi:hypothetical protein
LPATQLTVLRTAAWSDDLPTCVLEIDMDWTSSGPLVKIAVDRLASLLRDLEANHVLDAGGFAPVSLPLFGD